MKNPFRAQIIQKRLLNISQYFCACAVICTTLFSEDRSTNTGGGRLLHKSCDQSEYMNSTYILKNYIKTGNNLTVRTAKIITPNRLEQWFSNHSSRPLQRVQIFMLHPILPNTEQKHGLFIGPQDWFENHWVRERLKVKTWRTYTVRAHAVKEGGSGDTYHARSCTEWGEGGVA